MNGSELASTTASNPKSKEDPAGNGLQEKEKNPFAEYMWMENEEDFDRQEMLEEEEERDWFIPARDLPQGMGQLQQQLRDGADDILSKSTLNPDAKEFVPGVKY
uniref:polyadenylate-binding protein-interacting protein 2B isoform X2 n=1 Tax=Lonchura striata TaxID=40157 RepID=UPI000B4CE9A8|nr:polyadenylate-binding protein-interacting protein 2B isoform X2 [Lonchura striata domestica]